MCFHISCHVLSDLHRGVQSHTQANRHQQSRTYTHKSPQGVFMLRFYFAALELIFAEGLTDITKLHLTYQDLAPVVFTQQSQHECVCQKMIFHVCVYTPVFIWKRRSGRVGGHQLAHVFFQSSSCRQLTSGGRCCVCVNVPNDLNTHTHARPDMHTDLLAQGF